MTGGAEGSEKRETELACEIHYQDRELVQKFVDEKGDRASTTSSTEELKDEDEEEHEQEVQGKDKLEVKIPTMEVL